MNTQLTELAFILDRSGSMGSVAGAAIEGFNHFLHAQQAAPGQARLTLVLFDDEYLMPAASWPVAEVLPLDRTTYVPRNSTALLDAIGRTIDELGARLAALPDAERPGKVIIAILTDGLENASQRYTWGDVAARIRHQTQVYQWEFLFLGANQDAIATAAQLQIATTNAASFRSDAIGHRSSSAAIGRKMAAMRACASGAPSPAEEGIAFAPMQELVSEEDEQRRRKSSPRKASPTHGSSK
jgi:hypothetical protein